MVNDSAELPTVVAVVAPRIVERGQGHTALGERAAQRLHAPAQMVGDLLLLGRAAELLDEHVVPVLDLLRATDGVAAERLQAADRIQDAAADTLDGVGLELDAHA